MFSKYAKRMRLTRSEENYLKSIFKLSGKEQSNVSTSALAEELNAKAASVTDMVKKISDKGLCEYIKYKGVRLSSIGLSYAVNIVRKHRLWELFLVEKLSFGWEEVHEVAEQLEHIKSEKLIKQLESFLDFPKWDPHGNPIPDSEGNIPKRSTVQFNLVESGFGYVLLGVNQDDPDFLNYLNQVGLHIGKEIELIQKYEFDGSMQIELEGKGIQISKEVAKCLLVKEKV